MDGVERIAAERKRQIEVEGWTPEHDAEHDDGSLALVAALYATPVRLYGGSVDKVGVLLQDAWPPSWGEQWDKRAGYGDTREGEENDGANFPPDPSTYLPGERLDLLTKAGALIAAEIDRLMAQDQEEGT